MTYEWPRMKLSTLRTVVNPDADLGEGVRLEGAPVFPDHPASVWEVEIEKVIGGVSTRITSGPCGDPDVAAGIAAERYRIALLAE